MTYHKDGWLNWTTSGNWTEPLQSVCLSVYSESAWCEWLLTEHVCHTFYDLGLASPLLICLWHQFPTVHQNQTLSTLCLINPWQAELFYAPGGNYFQIEVKKWICDFCCFGLSPCFISWIYRYFVSKIFLVKRLCPSIWEVSRTDISVSRCDGDFSQYYCVWFFGRLQ